MGNSPRDVLRRVFDVARLAVNTVLRVDLKALLAAFLNHLINPRRAVALGGFVELREIARDRNAWVRKYQVDRLVFLVIGIRNEDR